MPLYLKDGKSVFYVHVPKTGGTSIHAFLLANGFEGFYADRVTRDAAARYRWCMEQHMDAGQIKSILRPGRFDSLFMTIRNPLARCVSAYKMQLRNGAKLGPVDVWFERTAELYRGNNFIYSNHIRPQSHFWLENCAIFRQEDGFTDGIVAHIEEKTKLILKKRKMRRANTTRSIEVDPADIARLEPMVREFYRMDYEKFGY